MCVYRLIYADEFTERATESSSRATCQSCSLRARSRACTRARVTERWTGAERVRVCVCVRA